MSTKAKIFIPIIFLIIVGFIIWYFNLFGLEFFIKGIAKSIGKFILFCSLIFVMVIIGLCIAMGEPMRDLILSILRIKR